MQLDEPELLIDATRDFGEQVGRVCVGVARGETDGLARGLAEGRERARNGEDMLAAIRDAKRIGNEEGAFGCSLNSPICGAAEPAGAFGEQIGVVLDSASDSVEEFVNRDEARPANIPMRLFHLGVQIDRRRKMLVQELDGLNANVLGQVLCVCCMVVSPYVSGKMSGRRLHAAT